jgi:hypothetical protein
MRKRLSPLAQAVMIAKKVEIPKSVQSFAYPNPAKDWVKINTKKSGLYYITDLQGKVIPAGIHFIKYDDQVFKLMIAY